MTQLILASTSPYRRNLMSRLRLPFETRKPNVSEDLLPGEPPGAMAWRLAEAKARSVPCDADSVVVGSDQVLEIDGQKLGKPGTHERAFEQLMQVSGRWVRFHTGLCVWRPGIKSAQTCVETYDLRFRKLDAQLVEAYLRTEQPYDCAGSLKAEGLGIVLLAEGRGADQTTLLGLPLMRLVTLLERAGVSFSWQK